MRGHRVLDWATDADHAELADVMFDAIRHGRSAYTEEQRAQWAPARRSGTQWRARLARQAVAVMREGHAIAGFMSLDDGGYIDLAYVRPAAQGSGLFRKLFDRIAARSAARGDATLLVHASLMAEPAFAAMGFEVIERQSVRLGDEVLERAEMARRSTGDRSSQAVG